MSKSKEARNTSLGYYADAYFYAVDGLDRDGKPLPVETRAETAARVEAQLAAKIKAEHPEVILVFAGMALWITLTTPAGKVECRPVVFQ